MTAPIKERRHMSLKIKKAAAGFLFFALTAAGLLSLAAGCGARKVGKASVKRDDLTVTIPGMTKEVKLFFLSDLHITTLNDQISEADRDTVKGRVEWSSLNGVPSERLLDDWVGYINASSADYVLFGADLLDCCAKKNADILKAGLDKLKKPYMYIRADHDSKPYYLSGVSDEDCLGYQEGICDNSDVMTEDFGEFLVVGWNNSTENITEGGLRIFKEACATGKPIILLTHVPIEPVGDDSLTKVSKEVFDGRVLLWGLGESYYFADDNTVELLNMIYAEDSPVKEILCGHLHFSWDGPVTDTVHEHVFSQAFGGFGGIVTVKGE